MVSYFPFTVPFLFLIFFLNLQISFATLAMLYLNIFLLPIYLYCTLNNSEWFILNI